MLFELELFPPPLEADALVVAGAFVVEAGLEEGFEFEPELLEPDELLEFEEPV